MTKVPPALGFDDPTPQNHGVLMLRDGNYRYRGDVQTLRNGVIAATGLLPNLGDQQQIAETAMKVTAMKLYLETVQSPEGKEQVAFAGDNTPIPQMIYHLLRFATKAPRALLEDDIARLAARYFRDEPQPAE